MLLLAVIAGIPGLSNRVQATARIMKSQRVDQVGWKNSGRKREIVIHDGGRKLILRLIEFE